MVFNLDIESMLQREARVRAMGPNEEMGNRDSGMIMER